MSVRMVGTTLALLVLAAPITAQAGSYDCAKASTRIEKTICDDPGLSNLDDRLAASYRTQRARLGSTGAAWVKASQANWLRWMRAMCKGQADLPPCLEQVYAERIGQLERTVVVDAPGFRVVLIHDYDRPGHGPYAELLIETVARDSDRAFNGSMTAYSRSCVEDEPSSSSHAEITWARPDLVSAIVTIGCEAPTGRILVDRRGFTARTGKGALRATDLFATGRDWAEKLVRSCQSDLAAQAAMLPVDHRPDAETVADLTEANCPYADRPERWALSPDGLVVLIDRSGLWGDWKDLEDVRIPWSSLESVLIFGRP